VARSTVAEWAGRAGFPAKGPHGWNIDEVKAWRGATVLPQGPRQKGESEEGVRAELLRAQADERRAKADLADLRLKIERGEYATLAEIREWDTSRASVVKRGLLSFSRSLPSALIGLNEKEMAVLIEQRVRELLERFGRFNKKELQAESTSST
jgi:hypothetical protein